MCVASLIALLTGACKLGLSPTKLQPITGTELSAMQACVLRVAKPAAVFKLLLYGRGTFRTENQLAASIVLTKCTKQMLRQVNSVFLTATRCS